MPGAGAPRPLHTARRLRSTSRSCDDELTHALAEVVTPPLLVVQRQRRLERRAREVRQQHERVREVHDRGLGRAREHLAWMGHEPLVELVGARDEHSQRSLRGATRAPGLLAE